VAASSDLDAGAVNDSVDRLESAAFLTLAGVTVQLPANDDAMELPVGTKIRIIALGSPRTLQTNVRVSGGYLAGDDADREAAYVLITKSAAQTMATILSGPVSFRNNYKQ
jgi:hypothetical protein